MAREIGLDADKHWQNFAEQYRLLGSPLRPCAQDIRILEEMLATVTDLFGAGAKMRALLLGVTPEIAAVAWPQTVGLVAVERVRAVIDAAWPGNAEGRQAACADWLNAPFPDESFDLAIGDGCLTAVGFPDELSRLIASIHRCLRRDGYLMLRLFCGPEVPETPASVIAALRAGEIGSFHAFKWRLAMAIQGIDDSPDVAVDAIWQVWNDARIDAREVAAVRGWPVEQLGTIEYYRESPARYNFMRFDATIGYLQQAGFDLVETRTGSYELAERCPHVLLRKRHRDLGAGAS